MTITIHDGSEGSTYDSYAALEAADAYHVLRATPEWTGTEAVKEAALVRATDFIDATYVFPCGPLIDDAVHPLVIKATIIMAAHALAGDLAAKETRDVIETEQELAGVGKKRVKYDNRSVSDPYPLVTALLAPITSSVGDGVMTGSLTR